VARVVGAAELGWWPFEPKCFRRLEIDDKLVFGRRLHRQVAGLFALEDAVDVAGGAPERVGCIRSVGDQAAASWVVSKGVDGGQSVAGHERDDQFAMKRRQWAPRHDQ